MIKKIQTFIGSVLIAFMLNVFIFVALKFMHLGEWILSFILLSFLVTIFLVYKMLRNSELANTDSSMPLERRIEIKKTELIVEGILYAILFLLPFSLVIAVKSFSINTIWILFIAAIVLFLKIKKAMNKKYNEIQELAKTKI